MLALSLPTPLPPAMRRLLLDLLDLGYPPGAPQRALHNAPDARVAWQVQSMLEDFIAPPS